MGCMADGVSHLWMELALIGELDLLLSMKYSTQASQIFDTSKMPKCEQSLRIELRSISVKMRTKGSEQNETEERQLLN